MTSLWLPAPQKGLTNTTRSNTITNDNRSGRRNISSGVVGVGVGGRSRKKRLLGPPYEERCRSAVLASQQRKAALGGGDDVKKVALFVPRNSVLEYDRCVARRYETS